MSRKDHFNDSTGSSIGRYLHKNRKYIISLMMIVMLFGIIGIFIRRLKNPETRSETLDKVIDTIDSTKIMDQNPLNSISEFYDLMQLEAETKEILKKDTLTSKDSLFLLEVNKKLNHILHEKY